MYPIQGAFSLSPSSSASSHHGECSTGAPQPPLVRAVLGPLPTHDRYLSGWDDPGPCMYVCLLCFQPRFNPYVHLARVSTWHALCKERPWSKNESPFAHSTLSWLPQPPQAALGLWEGVRAWLEETHTCPGRPRWDALLTHSHTPRPMTEAEVGVGGRWGVGRGVSLEPWSKQAWQLGGVISPGGWAGVGPRGGELQAPAGGVAS